MEPVSLDPNLVPLFVRMVRVFCRSLKLSSAQFPHLENRNSRRSNAQWLTWNRHVFYMTEGCIILGTVMKVLREDGRGGMSHAPGELNTYSYSPASSLYKDWMLQGWPTRAGWLSTSHLSTAAPSATPTFSQSVSWEKTGQGRFSVQIHAASVGHKDCLSGKILKPIARS